MTEARLKVINRPLGRICHRDGRKAGGGGNDAEIIA